MASMSGVVRRNTAPGCKVLVRCALRKALRRLPSGQRLNECSGWRQTGKGVHIAQVTLRRRAMSKPRRGRDVQLGAEKSFQTCGRARMPGTAEPPTPTLQDHGRG